MRACNIPHPRIIDEEWTDEQLLAMYLQIQEEQSEQTDLQYKVMLRAASYAYHAPNKAPKSIMGKRAGQKRYGPDKSKTNITASNARWAGLKHTTSEAAKRAPTEEKPVPKITPQQIAQAKAYRENKRKRRGQHGSVFSRVDPPPKK